MERKRESIRRILRDLEEQISNLEDKLKEVSEKLEHPLDVNESVADLGQQYVEIQAALDDKWQDWNNLFLD